MTGYMSLEDFLKSRHKSMWVNYGPYEIYVRKTRHWCGDSGIQTTFDIASITNSKLDEKTKPGGFWKMLTVLDKLLTTKYASLGIDAVYAENVLNARLLSSLEARGWRHINRDDGSTPSVYKMLVHQMLEYP